MGREEEEEEREGEGELLSTCRVRAQPPSSPSLTGCGLQPWAHAGRAPRGGWGPLLEKQLRRRGSAFHWIKNSVSPPLRTGRPRLRASAPVRVSLPGLGRPLAPLASQRSSQVRPAAGKMERAALFAHGREAPMAAGDVGELLVPYMPTIRVPKTGDRVYKTECAFSYDSPVSSGGCCCCCCPGLLASRLISFPASRDPGSLRAPTFSRDPPFPRALFTRRLPGLVSRGVALTPLRGGALAPFPPPVLSLLDYISPRPLRILMIAGLIRLNGKSWACL